jgi:transposase-like protein
MTACPYCALSPESNDPTFGLVVLKGFFYRRSDSKKIQRFLCKICRRGFSRATLSSCFNQKKRRVNFTLFQLLVSGVSQRSAARILKVHRVTVARKFLFLSEQARQKRLKLQLKLPLSKYVQFDEMESFEHSKCKPLSIPLAVDGDTRRILALDVCSMPAKGLLAKIARKKYGTRRDERPSALHDLMFQVGNFTTHKVEFLSDQKPSYPKYVRHHFTDFMHRTTKGRRGCVVGQGELKSGGYDPLFNLNHTAAMIRAHVNRLFRRTWCTTKKAENLKRHLEMYAYYHNQYLVK